MYRTRLSTQFLSSPLNFLDLELLVPCINRWTLRLDVHMHQGDIVGDEKNFLGHLRERISPTLRLLPRPDFLCFQSSINPTITYDFLCILKIKLLV